MDTRANTCLREQLSLDDDDDDDEEKNSLTTLMASDVRQKAVLRVRSVWLVSFFLARSNNRNETGNEYDSIEGINSFSSRSLSANIDDIFNGHLRRF